MTAKKKIEKTSVPFGLGPSEEQPLNFHHLASETAQCSGCAGLHRQLGDRDEEILVQRSELSVLRRHSAELDQVRQFLDAARIPEMCEGAPGVATYTIMRRLRMLTEGVQ